jgi:hypothetical protein
MLLAWREGRTASVRRAERLWSGAEEQSARCHHRSQSKEKPMKTTAKTLLASIAIILMSLALHAPGAVSAQDTCGIKSDGNYHCGTNCGYKADGNYHCGHDCGIKSDGKFHCIGDGIKAR